MSNRNFGFRPRGMPYANASQGAYTFGTEVKILRAAERARAEARAELMAADLGIGGGDAEELLNFLEDHMPAAMKLGDMNFEGGSRRRRGQRGGGRLGDMVDLVVSAAKSVKSNISAGASYVKGKASAAFPQTSAALGARQAAAAAMPSAAATALNSLMSKGINNAGVISTLAGILSATSAYNLGNPYMAAVRNALKLTLAVVPDPITLVKGFAGSALIDPAILADIGMLGASALTVGVLYYALKFGALAAKSAGKIAMSAGRVSARAIQAQEARLVAYVTTFVREIQKKLGDDGKADEAAVEAAGVVAAAAGAAAEAAVFAAPAGNAPVAGAGAIAPAAAAANAAGAAAPAAVVANAVAIAEAVVAGQDAIAAAEAQPGGIENNPNVAIAVVAAEAAALAAGEDAGAAIALVQGDVAHQAGDRNAAEAMGHVDPLGQIADAQIDQLLPAEHPAEVNNNGGNGGNGGNNGAAAAAASAAAMPVNNAAAAANNGGRKRATRGKKKGGARRRNTRRRSTRRRR